MSMYNLIHGQNAASDFLLALLNLTRADVGRFRDTWVTEEGTIAVYTRNGGGNRNCWHEDWDWYATEECTHEARTASVMETVTADEAEAAKHPEWKPLNVWVGSKREYQTGRRVPEQQYKCLEPDSEACSCPGCTIKYRLPNHPLYVSDTDDDYDCTYATIFFRVPDEAKPLVKGLEQDRNPGEEWGKAIEAVRQGKRDDVLKVLGPILSKITEAAS